MAAVALLAAGIWAELILPMATAAGTVAWLLVGYTLITLAGMTLFGQVAWLRHAELFEVELGWFGRIGPIGRRVVRRLCARAAAKRATRRGASTARSAPSPRRTASGGPSCARGSPASPRSTVPAGRTPRSSSSRLPASASTGCGETAFGAALHAALLPPVMELLGPTAQTFLFARHDRLPPRGGRLLRRVHLIVLAHPRAGRPERRRPLAGTAGAYAATLLPIAGGYLIAHYLTLVIQGACGCHR